MRLISIAVACIVLTSCSDVRLATVDECTRNPVTAVGCLTVRPVMYVADSLGDIGSGSGNAYSQSHSASTTKVPTLANPSKTWGE